MANKSLKKNYLYNLSYQILIIIAPIITTPYLSRVLNADGIGIVSFAESIVSYFVLFAALGVGTYGVVYMVSKISENYNDKENNLYVIKQISLYGLFS